jgi:hypothetical protein
MSLTFLQEKFPLRAHELVSLSCIRAYFVSWVKLLGPPLAIPKALRKL